MQNAATSDGPRAALAELAVLAGLPGKIADDVDFVGDDPVIPTQYRVGTAGAVALAATGIAAARLWEMRNRNPQRVRVELPAATLSLRASRYMRINGAVPPSEPQPFSGFFPLRDGRWIYLHSIFPNLRAQNLKVIGASSDPEAVRAATRQWSGPELEDAIFEGGGCGAFVRTRAEWESHPHAAAIRNQPILEIIRIGDAPPKSLPSGERPLSGIRVLDLTRVIAGPICARILAEHGADVLKVTRADLSNSGWLDIDTGIGKLATHLDLRKSSDAACLRQLVGSADVFSQGYRPGALSAHGLGAEELAALRPGLIYVSLNAWGYAGPWSNRRGFDTVVHSANGMAAASGDASGPKLMPVAVIDYVSGALMAFGAMVALARRATEGGSWHVRVSLATAGRWIIDRGVVAPEQFRNLPAELPQDYIDRFSSEIDGPLGRVRYLGPVVALPDTPLRLSRPPVALGSSPPQWPL